jgi:hypothetical protein
MAGTSLGLSVGTASTSAAAKVVPLGTSSGGDGLRLHCRPRIDGEAAVVIIICCRSRVGVVSGTGDLTRCFPDVVEGVAADNGDDLVDQLGDWRDGGDDGKRPRGVGCAGKR